MRRARHSAASLDERLPTLVRSSRRSRRLLLRKSGTVRAMAGTVLRSCRPRSGSDACTVPWEPSAFFQGVRRHGAPARVFGASPRERRDDGHGSARVIAPIDSSPFPPCPCPCPWTGRRGERPERPGGCAVPANASGNANGSKRDGAGVRTGCAGHGVWYLSTRTGNREAKAEREATWR